MEEAAYWLVSTFCAIHHYLPRDGTAHCGLGPSMPHQSPIKKMPPQACLQTNLRGIFYIKVPSSAGQW